MFEHTIVYLVGLKEGALHSSLSEQIPNKANQEELGLLRGQDKGSKIMGEIKS